MMEVHTSLCSCIRFKRALSLSWFHILNCSLKLGSTSTLNDELLLDRPFIAQFDVAFNSYVPYYKQTRNRRKSRLETGLMLRMHVCVTFPACRGGWHAPTFDLITFPNCHVRKVTAHSLPSCFGVRPSNSPLAMSPLD